MIVPALANNPTTKVSKAAMLNKTAEFAQKLKTERQEMQTESDLLQKEIEALNAAIGSCQQQLPATGVPITSQNNEQMQQMLRAYIQERTTQNWKFYIFSKLATPLFDSFNSVVSTAGTDELYRTTHAWLDHHCTLPALRTAVLNSLRTICKETSILSEPRDFRKKLKALCRLQRLVPATPSHRPESV
ncbi:MLXIPL [Bugula neritina]|uniref:MLXIPL n=1 Tax=Bugula neritina TaxID=10212 RepID=A0A7J7KC22_BUGNE|nr:MLXIPL [Bugula neritina]